MTLPLGCYFQVLVITEIADMSNTMMIMRTMMMTVMMMTVVMVLRMTVMMVMMAMVR